MSWVREFEHADQDTLARARLLKIDTSQMISASPQELWRIVGNHQTWPTWHDDYADHQALTDQDQGLGATFSSQEWWRLRSESEITRWEDGHVVGLTTRRATFWRWIIRSTYHEIEIESVPGQPNQSRVHYRTVFSGAPLFWIFCAYSIAHALFGLHLTAKSSLKALAKLATDER